MCPSPGDLAHNPGMCPDWESNWWPFGSQAFTQSIELPQPGPFISVWVLLPGICPFHWYSLSFFLRKILFTFQTERKGGRKRETNIDVWEKHQWAASQRSLSGDLVFSPGMYSDQKLNWWPLGLEFSIQPLSHTSQGSLIFSKINLLFCRLSLVYLCFLFNLFLVLLLLLLLSSSMFYRQGDNWAFGPVTLHTRAIF